jgi:SAM-dependent methyltransferase
VGPTGSVLGIDRSPEVMAVARRRVQEAGQHHVVFDEADASTWRAPEPFDVLVGRLLLFHVADPVAVVRHQIGNLRPGGTFVALDFDLGGSRAEPPVAMVSDVLAWVQAAFRAAGAWPRIGSRLGTILQEAGLSRVTTFGVQAYIQSSDPSGPALLAGVTRSLAPAIVRHGIASAEQLDVATPESRIADAVRQANAVILPPTLVGAWGNSS